MKKRFLIFMTFCSLQLLALEQPQIFPPKIAKGDLIALVFPASFLNVESGADEILKRKAEWLNKRGYNTIYYPTKINNLGYLAGTDQERAKALMSAWKNPAVKAIWCVRGGYGSGRIIDLLDYEWIKTHPKILLGMSDITTLHQVIQSKTGLVTFLTPVLNYFAEDGDSFDDNYAFSSFEDIVVKEKSGPIAYPKKEVTFKVISPGKAQGRLVGGNLTLIASMCGTKWQLNSENKILILEDVNEDIYRIDRLLWQLTETGVLKNPAAVILSSFKDCKSKYANTLTLEDVFERYFKNAKYPVIYGFPSGHDKYQSTVPLNVEAIVDSEKMSVELLQPAVSNN